MKLDIILKDFENTHQTKGKFNKEFIRRNWQTCR